MRLRHIPGAEQMIEDSPYVIQNPEERKGKWHEVFGNHNPIRIEVGMGTVSYTHLDVYKRQLYDPALSWAACQEAPSRYLRS